MPLARPSKSETTHISGLHTNYVMPQFGLSEVVDSKNSTPHIVPLAPNKARNYFTLVFTLTIRYAPAS